MAIIYLTKDGGGWTSPVNGSPMGLADLFHGLRDDGLIEIAGCEPGPGRTVTPAAITKATSSLRIVARHPLKFGEVAASYASATSSGISWPGMNCARMQSAANSIPAVAAAGGVIISGANGRYIATFNKVGVRTHLTFSGLGAVPDVYSRTSTVTAGDGSTRAVQLIEVEPAAIQLLDDDDWTAIPAPVLSAAVTAGTSTTPEVVVISFDRIPAGGDWTAANGTWQTAGISVFATAREVEDAINKVAGALSVKVFKPSPWNWEVTFTTLGNAANITVDDAGVIPHVGIYGLTDWRAIQKYGFEGMPTVPARAILTVVFADGQSLHTSQNIEVNLDSAPAVSQVLTSSPVPSNLIGEYPATEAIAASRFVQIYSNSGTDSIRAGSASNSYDADGYIISSVASGGTVYVYGSTGTLAGLSGRTTGNTQYLGEAGEVTESAPVVGIRQDLGEATSDGQMSVDIQPPVIL